MCCTPSDNAAVTPRLLPSPPPHPQGITPPHPTQHTTHHPTPITHPTPPAPHPPQGMKNDFGGHDNHHYGNIYAYAGEGLGVCSQQPGHEDFFYGNKVVVTVSYARLEPYS